MATRLTKREKALELANRTRVELGKNSLHMTLLECKTICRYLGISEQNDWIDLELNGYNGKFKTIGEAREKIPKYRHVGMQFYDEYNREVVVQHSIQEIFGIHAIEQPISEIESFRKNGMTIISSNIIDAFNSYISKRGTSYTQGHIISRAHVSNNYIERIISGITNRIHKFLDELILELEYGEIPENIFEGIRDEVDKKLTILCPNAAEKLPIIYEQLSTGKPVVYSQIASTCRTIIKDVADSLFPVGKSTAGVPPSKVKLDESAYLNRILTSIKSQIDSNSETSLFSSMFQYVEAFLKSINDYASKGDHSQFNRTDATRCIVYTYLLLGDILHYYAKKSTDLTNPPHSTN